MCGPYKYTCRAEIDIGYRSGVCMSSFHERKDGSKIRAAQGDTVKVRYTGRLADGTIFDASPEDRPLTFILGRKEVIAGFEEVVEGMYQGESKTFTLPPEKAYGPHELQYVEEIERSQLPPGVDLQLGHQLEISMENGDKLLVLITGLTEESVTLDGNHPLAGKELTFDMELLEVKKNVDPTKAN